MAGWSGREHGWRYLAQRIDGDGQPGAWLDTELPLQGVRVTEVLSGPPRITGTLEPTHRRLIAGDGRPLLDEWATVIYPEASGQLRGGGIYRRGQFDGPRWQLDCAGFTSYPHGMGYEDERSFVDVDPLLVVRHLWEQLQAGLDSNLGLLVDDSTTTPVRVGTVEEPFLLNPWTTDDVGAVIDDLTRSTPFDYLERHYWNQRRDEVLHELTFGHPRIGVRRPDLRFVFGENIHTTPDVVRDGDRYASHVRFLGAGEGRDMVRAEARMRAGRLRRMVTVDDKSITAPEWAQRHARRELTARQLRPTIADVLVRDSPAAPIAALQVGDEIRVQGEVDWVQVDQWCRVVAITIAPDSPEVAGLSLVRSEFG